ncbi:MAG: PAS domain S-box protein [Alphaproteobacteria bacterium]|nr:MAG: PAS domain S-box protein [Alphaproteobacteria bacterium]
MGALIFSGLIAVLLAIKVYKAFNYRRTPFSKYFILLMLSISLWSVSYAFEVGFIDIELKYFFARFQYLGIVLIPLAWFLFAAEYSGICRQFVRKYKRIFFLLPSLTFLLIITNSLQKLYFESSYLDASGAFPLFVFDYGPLFWVFYIYSFILIILGIFFFTQFVLQTTFYRNQTVVALTAACIPLIGNMLHIAHIDPFKFFDPTPFLFTVTGLIFFWGIIEHEFLNIIPIARESVIESMNDGYIVVDFTNSIVDINESALKLAGKARKEVVGRKLNEAFGEKMELYFKDANEGNFGKEISLESGLETKFFNLSISSLTARDNMQGKLVIIHDITEIYRYQDDLKQANKKINLMSNITRHDILNQVNVLSGYTALISEALPQDIKNDPRIRKYLKNLNKGIEMIHNQISFTKDYQELGVVSPTWQSITSVAKEAASPFSGQGLKFSIEEKGLEVYADPLFKKVFYNLFENSKTHGEHVTEISVSSHKIEKNLVIDLTDNGIGISPNMKELIFEKSVGKNTGLGLFLVRGILSITDMEIKETGIKGEGAKFEITVPPGNWRENISE